ncbi:hypothetical protein ACFL29_00950 [Patescibacteria group bacterium]
MYKLLLIFIIFILLGSGCSATKDVDLNLVNIRDALWQTGNELEWTSGVMEQDPRKENHYGNSHMVYSEYQEKGLTTERNSVEVIEFETVLHADRAYGEEECFKGKGELITISGIDGCCLTDMKEKTSEVVMLKDKYIFRAFDYFYPGCRAEDYLRRFWDNLE